MEDWSKLITINYPHGYHGDFIACLITKTDPEITEGLTATYTTPGITSAFGVKNLDVIVGMHLDQKNRDFFVGEDTEFARRQRNYYSQVRGSHFIQNLIDDLRWQFNHLRGVKTVFNTHYCRYQSYLPLKDIFPRSLNVRLTLENMRNKPIYDFLFEHKILNHYGNTSAYKFYRGNPHDRPHMSATETPVYVDRLMAENGFEYAKELEKLFDCDFDTRLLNIYKIMNERLLTNNGYKYEALDHW